jgi:hypothetical protein
MVDEAIVDKAQNLIDYEAARNPSIKRILGIVKQFIQKKRVMCYGGTAINNLLPPKDRFYDPNYDIPDYDFFSEQPQIHALQLADEFYEHGFRAIEVKPGSHLMTFKVFVDYTGVADITYLEPTIFKKLWDANLHRDNIHYVTPNFLRMSMYLELSRPRGDVSRWMKVYKRLMLLNKYYPIKCSDGIEIDQSDTLTPEERQGIETIMQKEHVVLLGIHAFELHSKAKSNVWHLPIDVLTTPEKYDEVVEHLASVFGDRVKLVEQDAYAELLPKHMDIIETESGYLLVRVFQAYACHSYHTVTGIKVGSIPTLLQFFFGCVYASAHYLEGYDENRIICICQRLIDMAHSAGKRRFELLTPLDCIGHQETLTDMKIHKGTLYENTPKNSPKFLQLFFSYKPGSLTKTQKARVRKTLKSTMKASSIE